MARIPANIKSHNHLTDLARQLDTTARRLYSIMMIMQEGVRDEQLVLEYNEKKNEAFKLMQKIGVSGRRITRMMRKAPVLYDRVELELVPMEPAYQGCFKAAGFVC